MENKGKCFAMILVTGDTFILFRSWLLTTVLLGVSWGVSSSISFLFSDVLFVIFVVVEDIPGTNIMEADVDDVEEEEDVEEDDGDGGLLKTGSWVLPIKLRILDFSGSLQFWLK